MKYTTGEYSSSIPLFSGGEWDPKVVRTVMESLYRGETHYVDVPGNSALRGQLREYLQGEGVAEGGEILVTAGIQEARFLTVQVLGKDAGMIGFPEVVHPGVREVLTVRELDHVVLETGADPRMLTPVSTIGDALLEGVKVLYIESPSRFTGACYEKDELVEIVSLCRKNGALLIIDSGLRPLTDAPCDSPSPRFVIDDRLVMIGEAWPGCGIEDLFIGYILASEDAVKRITTQKQVISICTSAPSQNGAIAAGADYRKKRPEILSGMKKKRAMLEAGLSELGLNILPGRVAGFVGCEAGRDLKAKLDAAGVHYLDGTYFGKPGFIQLSVSSGTLNIVK